MKLVILSVSFVATRCLGGGPDVGEVFLTCSSLLILPIESILGQKLMQSTLLIETRVTSNGKLPVKVPFFRPHVGDEEIN